MILRMVLLPSDAERVISQEPKLYSYFFSSNAPHVLLRLLCSAKVSENAEIRHIETRNSLIAGLTEICRFITLVIVKRDEIEILTKRQKAPMHQNTLTVLGLIQNFLEFEEGSVFPMAIWSEIRTPNSACGSKETVIIGKTYSTLD